MYNVLQLKSPFMFRIIRISGKSMYPHFHHGDFVLIRKAPISFHRYKVGDIIVFEDHIYGQLIKRIDQIDAETLKFFVVGEHEDSLDSRQLGWVGFTKVAGKVIHHIHPRR